VIFGKPQRGTPRSRGEWHLFTPWIPRHVEGVGWVWLQPLARKTEFVCGPAGGRYDNAYRLPGCDEGFHQWFYTYGPSGLWEIGRRCDKCRLVQLPEFYKNER
jgi:hypothetical protein